MFKYNFPPALTRNFADRKQCGLRNITSSAISSKTNFDLLNTFNIEHTIKSIYRIGYRG